MTHLFATVYGLVAQWLEQRTHNPSVVGSIPTRPTMNIGLFDVLYLFYIAMTESLFVQIFTILTLYILSLYIKYPRENWYYDDSSKPSKESMPRYNLNHEDVSIITEALDKSSMNASSTKEHTRITNLKNRLLSKLQTSDDDVDVWTAFQGNK